MFLKKDLKKHSGQWVAIIDKKIVDSGDDVGMLVKEVKKRYPLKKPMITKVKNNLSIL